MSFDFGWNADDEIGIKPSRIIRSPCPQITRTRKGRCDIFNLVIRMSYFSLAMHETLVIMSTVTVQVTGRQITSTVTVQVTGRHVTSTVTVQVTGRKITSTVTV